MLSPKIFELAQRSGGLSTRRLGASGGVALSDNVFVASSECVALLPSMFDVAGERSLAMSNTQLASVTVRIDRSTRDRLAREAAQDRRPLSQHVRNILDDALRDREQTAEAR